MSTTIQDEIKKEKDTEKKIDLKKIKSDDEELLKKMLLKFDSAEIEKIIKVGKNLVKEKKAIERSDIMKKIGEICFSNRNKILKSDDLDKNMIKNFETYFDLSAAGEYLFKNRKIFFEKGNLSDSVKIKIEKLLTKFSF